MSGRVKNLYKAIQNLDGRLSRMRDLGVVLSPDDVKAIESLEIKIETIEMSAAAQLCEFEKEEISRVGRMEPQSDQTSMVFA